MSVWLRYANGHAGKLRDVRLHDGEHEIAAWGPHPFTTHGEVMTEVSSLNLWRRVGRGELKMVINEE